MACRTPKDFNFYPIVKKKEMKFINAEYEVQVGYWAEGTICKITKSM
jgi:hypothetical protein